MGRKYGQAEQQVQAICTMLDLANVYNSGPTRLDMRSGSSLLSVDELKVIKVFYLYTLRSSLSTKYSSFIQSKDTLSGILIFSPFR